MQKYIRDGQSAIYTDSTIIDTDPILGEMMISGWVAGKVMLKIFENYYAAVSAAKFQEIIYEPNTVYTIAGDLLVGGFSGTCATNIQSIPDVLCECNQGGRAVFLKSIYSIGATDANAESEGVNSTSLTFMPRSDYNLAFTRYRCYLNDFYTIPKPLSLIVFNFVDNSKSRLALSAAVLYTVLTLFTDAQDAVTSKQAYELLSANTTSFSYQCNMLSSTADSVVDRLIEEEEAHFTSVIVGPVPNDDFPDETFVLAPIFEKLHFTTTTRNMVYLMPTFEQQMYAACSFFVTAVASDLIHAGHEQPNVVMKGIPKAQRATVSQLLEASAYTFGVTLYVINFLEAEDSVVDYLFTSGGSLVMGCNETDSAALYPFIAAHDDAIVIMMYEDFATHYETLVTSFLGATELQMYRMCAITNLPIWTHTTAAYYERYPIVQSFHESYGATAGVPMGDDAISVLTRALLCTPRAMEAWVTGRFVKELASLTSGSATGENLMSALYTTSTFAIDGMSFGPYYDGLTNATGSTSSSARTYGAQNLAVLSILALFTNSVSYTFDTVTPSMVYKDRVSPVRGLTKSQIAGIVVGTLTGVVLIVATVVVIVHYFFGTSRDNRTAPKDPTRPVTLLFTDIQSSTALWAACPQEMPDAVSAHHSIIRGLIVKHKCYEVKTIGDAFMIASGSAYAAVRLAYDLQIAFLKYDWDSASLNRCYDAFEHTKAQDDPTYHAPVYASEEERQALWNGLRVRIGIHTGLADIREDETTHGFDYYGDTSNLAARTEAIGNGGQVLLTDAAWYALSETERASLTVKDLGLQALRGVPHPVNMFQLECVPGRQFADLRTELEVVLPDEMLAPEENNANSSANASLSDMNNSSAANAARASVGTAGSNSIAHFAVASVLVSCFSAYPPARRVKELQPLLDRWNVTAVPRGRDVTADDYCRALIHRLAAKIGSVVDMRESVNVSGCAESSISHLWHARQAADGRHSAGHTPELRLSRSAAATPELIFERLAEHDTLNSPDAASTFTMPMKSVSVEAASVEERPLPARRQGTLMPEAAEMGEEASVPRGASRCGRSGRGRAPCAAASYGGSDSLSADSAATMATAAPSVQRVCATKREPSDYFELPRPLLERGSDVDWVGPEDSEASTLRSHHGSVSVGMRSPYR
ncbi:receptor-type adenylate cyclase A [Strigomonas culicis]|uniref:adenylate cyclase n=1 Tax=Strigomonas culicis TaxID=28005 RepID=S9U2J1_9TRYP|nr:receptor-type adenylate cyclase A [Strigomonas culicis]|eukprot:EPY25002.1 receptor-type adenylate cyclase A [Strigomonas culicis]